MAGRALASGNAWPEPTIHIGLDQKALANPALMVPTLEAIAKNSRFLHLAQTEAQDILQRIRVNN